MHPYKKLPLLFLALLFIFNFMPIKKKTRYFTPFQLRDLNGQITRLSDFEGKILVVNFWATWSSASLNTLQVLENINQQYAKKNVQIIGISVLSKEEDIPELLKISGANFPILIGNKKLIAQYGNFSSIPTTFIVDYDRKIVHQFSGTFKHNDIAQVLERLIQKSEPRVEPSSIVSESQK